MQDSKVGSPQIGDREVTAQRAQMYISGFREYVFARDGASFIERFCKDNTERAHDVSRKAQEMCVGNDKALVALAEQVKYVNAHLELAACYGKQIGIMSEHEVFRIHALNYIGLAYAELEAIEYFEPVQVAA